VWTANWRMRVRIVSDDRELHQLCREVVSDFPTLDWDFRGIKAGENLSPADAYIWDIVLGEKAVSGMAQLLLDNYLFLIDRKESDNFRGLLGRRDLRILLKPVTRSVLSAAIADLLDSFQVKECPTTESSARADCDQVLQCLIQANLKLQEFERGRSNFLARVAHDFRAPLNAIAGYCGLLLAEPLGPLTDGQAEVIRRMQTSSERLSRLASAMFRVSTESRVDSEPVLEPGDLQECVEHALQQTQPSMREKHIAVSVDLQPSPETLYFERMQMEQVFLNLLDNACKFTPRNGRIQIRGGPCFWERRPLALHYSSCLPDQREFKVRRVNCFRVDIQDSGPGIPPDHARRIFEEFATYSADVDRSGGGLGLAICKMILDRHQGQIWAENSCSGAVFSFVLPFKSVAEISDKRRRKTARLQ
jgi:signal transduction histidine kinase